MFHVIQGRDTERDELTTQPEQREAQPVTTTNNRLSNLTNVCLKIYTHGQCSALIYGYLSGTFRFVLFILQIYVTKIIAFSCKMQLSQYGFYIYWSNFLAIVV